MFTNSGVTVLKGEKKRFTCTFHGWDKVVKKDVYHLEMKMGVITDALGKDIGLIEKLRSIQQYLS